MGGVTRWGGAKVLPEYLVLYWRTLPTTADRAGLRFGFVLGYYPVDVNFHCYWKKIGMEFFFFWFVHILGKKKSAVGFEIGRGGKPAGAAATQGSLFLTNKPPPTMKPPFAESGYWKRHRHAAQLIFEFRKQREAD